MKSNDYSSKLLDPLWIQKRDSILKRDSYTCFDCGNKSGDVLVFHLPIVNDKNPWEFPDEQYITLCRKCRAFRRKCTEEIVNSFRIYLGRIKIVEFPVAIKHLNLFSDWTAIEGGDSNV